MKKTDDGIGERMLRIVAAAKTLGTAVLTSSRVEPARRVFATLSAIDFVILASTVGAKTMYVETSTFGLDAEIERLAAAHKLGPDDAEAIAACRDAVKSDESLRISEGEIPAEGSTVMVTYHLVVDGVIAAHHDVDPTYATFLERAGRSIDAFLTGRDADLETGRRKAIRERARALLADPRYDAPKATKGKREFLCQEINPDLSAKTCAAITEEAENIAWLAGVTPTAPPETETAA